MLYNFFYESSLKAYLMERFNSKVVYKKFVWLLQISHSLKIKKITLNYASTTNQINIY